MTRSASANKVTPPAEPGWGAAAVSMCGDFTVEVDESLSSATVELRVESSRIYVSCRFPDAKSLTELLESMQQIVAGNADTARKGRKRVGAVSLIRDEEGDRFYVWSRGGDAEVRFTLSRSEAEALSTAFRDVIDQLRS